MASSLVRIARFDAASIRAEKCGGHRAGKWAGKRGVNLTEPVPGGNTGKPIPDLAEISSTGVLEKTEAQG